MLYFHKILLDQLLTQLDKCNLCSFGILTNLRCLKTKHMHRRSLNTCRLCMCRSLVEPVVEGVVSQHKILAADVVVSTCSTPVHSSHGMVYLGNKLDPGAASVMHAALPLL